MATRTCPGTFGSGLAGRCRGSVRRVENARTLTCLAALAAYVVARRRQLRWGATSGEVSATLPGDELVPAPGLVATRAIGIEAAPEDVWPWLAQLGQGRGGFYSYDLLENLVAHADIHNADHIEPAWQHPRVGDDVRLHPDVALTVATVEPGRALVLTGGVPMGKVAAPYTFSWAFVLRRGPEGSTRLVVRERYGFHTWWARPLVEAVEVVSFVMSQKMLRGIRDRATAGPVAPTMRGPVRRA